MPWYLLRSYGPDENTEIWLEHDDEMSDATFSDLVSRVAQQCAVVQCSPSIYVHNKMYHTEDRNPQPWWGTVIYGVVERLISDHGFQTREAQSAIEIEWSESYLNFCPNPDEITETQRRMAATDS
jgi:hypothetical protein